MPRLDVKKIISQPYSVSTPFPQPYSVSTPFSQPYSVSTPFSQPYSVSPPFHNPTLCQPPFPCVFCRRGITSEGLIYIKEDLLIPAHYSFYDFIVTKARGKSGPLFNFDVHDDVRMVGDASVEKDESHAGKIILRSW